MKTKKKKIYYKLVRTNLVSARAPYKSQIIYSFGEWVFPKIKGSKLFVFNSLSAAKNFAVIGDVIFECEVLKPVKCKYMCHWAADTAAWWDVRNSSFKRMKKHKNTSYVPYGTMFVSAVKLVKQIF